MNIKQLIKNNYIIGTLLILGFIAIDQVTKLFAYNAQDSLDPNIILIPHILELSYTENYAASLGLLGNSDYKELIFVIVTVFALALFGYFFRDVDFKSKKLFSLSIVFFISGTLGNAIDRLFRGFVVDLLHFPFFDFLSHVGLSNFDNNIADILLFFAIFMFAIDIFFLDPKRIKSKEKILNENL
jgi:signal peptidase II